MTDVLDFPHTEQEGGCCAGGAVCVECGHKWVAVAPSGITELECPHCGQTKGIWARLCLMGDEVPHLICTCGSRFFSITEDYIYCVKCGAIQDFD